MEFQVVRSSKRLTVLIWTVAVLLGVVSTALYLISWSLLVKGIKMDPVPGSIICSVLAILCVMSLTPLEKRTAATNEENFRRQLKDEYNATSSRSFAAIRGDLHQYSESSTVFTQDGVDTQVFVKVLNADRDRITMAFTVVNNEALYPKSANNLRLA